MSKTDETVTLSGEEFERRLNVTHYSGRASALDELAAILKQTSGELWVSDETKTAHYLRDVVIPLVLSKAKEIWQISKQNREARL